MFINLLRTGLLNAFEKNFLTKTFRAISCFLVLVLFQQISLAQEKSIDSLKNDLSTLKDTARVDCLNALSFKYLLGHREDSAEYYVLLAYNEAKKNNYTHGIAETFYCRAGAANIFHNDFLKEEELARESITWYDKTPNKQNISIPYYQLGFSLFAQSSYEEAIKYLKKSYESSAKIGRKDWMQMANSLIGEIYRESGEYGRAFEILKQSIELERETNNNQYKAGDFAAIGELYMLIGDYTTALTYYNIEFQRSRPEEINVWGKMMYAELFTLTHKYDSALYRYDLFDTTKASKRDLHVYLVSKGEYYFATRQYDNALQNFLRGLAYHEQSNDKNQVKRVLLDIAKTYAAKNNFSASLKYVREGLSLASVTKSGQYIRDGYNILYMIYDHLHRKDSAYYYYQKYITTKDAVSSDQIKRKFEVYAYEQKIAMMNKERVIGEQQLKIQQQQIRQTALQKSFLLVGIAGLLLIGFIVVRNISLKRKNEKQRLEHEIAIQKIASERIKSELQQRATELKMQALRAQMNPHFIFNSLNSINRFILQNNRLKASEYLTKFSRLVRLILQNSQNSLITLESELEALELYLDLEALRFDNGFDYKISVEDDLNIAILKVPPLIIQPYVENAIWHGLMHLPEQEDGKKEKGQLHIEVKREKNYLLVKIADNGVGRERAAGMKSKSIPGHKSMGLRITADRIAMLQNAQGNESPVIIHDLETFDGSPAGTEVIIKTPVIYA
jgi:tetratricopeptide (TPR) repeat protein